MLNKNKNIYQGFVEQHLWMLLIEIHESPIDLTTRIIESSHPQPFRDLPRGPIPGEAQMLILMRLLVIIIFVRASFGDDKPLVNF